MLSPLMCGCSVLPWILLKSKPCAMSSNEGTVVCPLCQSKVPSAGGGDALQLHYLTSCSGYDKGRVSVIAWVVKLEQCVTCHTSSVK